MRFSTIIIFTSLLLTTVKAGVFTTVPFSKTIWTAGATETITWKDDDKAPSIQTLKKLQIDLFSGNDTSTQTFVRNVATNVDGNAKKFTYTVPTDIGPEGQFFLKYTQGTYVETSGVFQIIIPANLTIPASIPVTTGTGIYPTTASTPGANINTASPGSTSNPSNPTLTPTPLSGGSIFHINNLTLGSLMILSTLVLKYL